MNQFKTPLLIYCPAAACGACLLILLCNFFPFLPAAALAVVCIVFPALFRKFGREFAAEHNLSLPSRVFILFLFLGVFLAGAVLPLLRIQEENTWTGIRYTDVSRVRVRLKEDPRIIQRSCWYVETVLEMAGSEFLSADSAGVITLMGGGFPDELAKGCIVYCSGKTAEPGSGESFPLFIADSWKNEGWQHCFYQFRFRVFRSLEKALINVFRDSPPDTFAYMSALVLGKRIDSGSVLMRGFRQTGTLHLMALSGFHVGLLALCFRIALKPVFGYRVSALLSFCGAFFYLILVGGGPSLLRAVLMYGIWTAAGLRHRRIGGLGSLSLAFLLHFMLFPRELGELSFQLSYCALAGLMTAGRMTSVLLQRFMSRKTAFVIGAGIGAQMATVPLVIRHFGLWRPIGLIAAPLLTPFLAISMLGGLLLMITECVFPGNVLVSPGAAFVNNLVNMEEKLIVFFKQAPGIKMEAGWSWLLPVIPAIIIFIIAWRRHYEQYEPAEPRFPPLNPCFSPKPGSGTPETLGTELSD